MLNELIRLRAACGQLCALALAAVVWLVLARSVPVHGADAGVPVGVVTACGDDVELSSMLAGGGPVSFNCSGTHAPAVIPLSNVKAISLATTIDGGGVVTLDGHNPSIPRDSKQFELQPGTALTLSHITLSNGLANTTWADGNGGCIYAGANSRLVLLDVTLRNCRAADGYAGGGIYISGTASVWMLQSTINGSAATNGGGIYNAGTLALSGSVLSSNVVTSSGGGLLNVGSATLSGSDVVSNTATQNGGGIKNSGSLVLVHVSVSHNAATSGGGIINQGGTATLNDTTLDGNEALGSGGGIQNSGNATLSGSTLSHNLADTGGGGIANNYVMTLTNVTLSANTAAFGGGIDNILSMTLRNVTLADNSASDGGGLYNFSGSSLSLNNSIIANSGTGGNCSGEIGSAQYSLSSDASCTLTGAGNLANSDPLLSALGNYGGPTRVHMLNPGSPAIDAVLGAAPTADQRGVTRPQPAGGRPDMGAVERRVFEGDLPFEVYLPVVGR